MNTTVFENITLSTTTLRTGIASEEEDLGLSLGIFAAILFGSMVFIFMLMGFCILWHVFYMKCLKKEHQDEIIDNSGKPKVILDLSHQLEENDREDNEFENSTKRPIEMPKELDTAEFTNIEKEQPNNDRSQTNLAFVNSNMQLTNESGSNKNKDNYVNLAVSNI